MNFYYDCVLFDAIAFWMDGGLASVPFDSIFGPNKSFGINPISNSRPVTLPNVTWCSAATVLCRYRRQTDLLKWTRKKRKKNRFESMVGVGSNRLPSINIDWNPEYGNIEYIDWSAFDYDRWRGRRRRCFFDSTNWLLFDPFESKQSHNSVNSFVFWIRKARSNSNAQISQRFPHIHFSLKRTQWIEKKKWKQITKKMK